MCRSIYIHDEDVLLMLDKLKIYFASDDNGNLVSCLRSDDETLSDNIRLLYELIFNKYCPEFLEKAVLSSIELPFK